MNCLQLCLKFDRSYKACKLFTAQFEGSLGRLTTSSVHNPRQIIDVRSDNKPHSEEGEPKNVSKELRRSRQLLMEIENVSLCVENLSLYRECKSIYSEQKICIENVCLCIENLSL